MAPLDALKREILAELDAMSRRLGPNVVPDRLTITVETDHTTRMPRSVTCIPEWRRRVGSGEIAR